MICVTNVTFDYKGMAEEYKKFTTIVGSAGDSTSIAGILNDTNQDVTDYVDVLDQAIFGDLGKQLKMDWDNFSSDFPKFVEMFDSWATYVSAAAGDYSKAEADIASFNEKHPLGFASPEGMTQGYVQTGFYSQAYSSEDIQALRDMAQFYQLTGATYVDTGMVAFAKKSRLFNAAGDIFNLAGCVVGGASIFKSLNAFKSIGIISNATPSTALAIPGQEGVNALTRPLYVGVFNPANPSNVVSLPMNKIWQLWSINPTLGRIGAQAFAAQASFKVMGASSLGLAAASTGTNWLGRTFSKMGAYYNPDVYMSGQDYINAWGKQDVQVNGSSYHYAMTTPGGQQVYMDDQGGLFTYDGQNTTAVSNGDTGKPATIQDLDDTFTMNVGGETVTQDTEVTFETGDVNYRSYGSSLKGAVDVTGTPTPVEQTTEEVPTEEIPTEEIPTEEIPTEEIPTEEVPTE